MTSRGNEKKPVFKDDHDREAFLNTLRHVIKRYNWICHAYWLMTNHYHLLIETPEGNLSSTLTDHLKRHKDVPEIPRSQRYSTQPELSKLLPYAIVSDPRKLKRKLMEAIEKYGCHQSQLARHLSVHRSTISRWLCEYENENATKET